MAVYFLKAGDLIKIGYAKDVEARCNAIQAQCPVQLTLVAVIEFGDLSLEKSLHQDFKKYRSHGEWFKSNEKLEKIIEYNSKFDITILPKYYEKKRSYKISNEESVRRRERMYEFHKKGIAGPNFSHLGVEARRRKRDESY